MASWNCHFFSFSDNVLQEYQDVFIIFQKVLMIVR